MRKSRCTIIHFDVDGYYSMKEDGVVWNPKEAHTQTLVMKGTKEEITYFAVVDRLYEKLKLDKNTKKLKLCYIPIGKPVQSCIFDDEDLLGYLLEGNKNQEREVLHVEVIDGGEGVVREVIREDQGSGIDARIEEITSDAGANVEPVLMLDCPPHISVGESSRCEEESGDMDNNLVVDVVDNRQDVVVPFEWEDGIGFTIRQEFQTKKEVQDIVNKALHRNYFQVRTAKSTANLYVLKCQDICCKWSIRVRKEVETDRWSVKTYKNTHTCDRLTSSTSTKIKRGTPGLVKSVVQADYPGISDIPTPRNLIALVQGRFGVRVSYSTAWRGRNEAASEVRGTSEEGFSLLASYLYMLEKVNEGTVTSVECDEQGKFKFLFIALGACIEGFQAMRKVIIIDGTHLSGKYGGLLLIATAHDKDRHHYPLAFGVGDKRNKCKLGIFSENVENNCAR